MLAVAFAVHVTVVPLSVPAAVPTTFRPPAHDALNDPAAEVGDCWAGVHLKSVQLDGDGSTLAVADCQEPMSASTPVVELGLVTVVLFSYAQPLAAAHTASPQAKM
jgi:hypothetical protein